MYTILVLMMLFLIFRLYAVTESGIAAQVLSGQYTRKLNAVGRRGFIFDRNGETLNAQRDGYICIVNPAACNNEKITAGMLADYTETPESEIRRKMTEKAPFTLKLRTKVFGDGLGCFPLYRMKTLCAPHTVGYTDVSGNGVTGIEKYFNTVLSSTFSGKVNVRYMADANGGKLDGSGVCIYDDGYTDNSGIYLTLDKDLQLYCEELVRKYPDLSGAICVTDIKNGEILACVSFPGFDTEKTAELLESTKGELVNRCTAGFTPGSIFKTVVAAAALELDPMLAHYEYECNGSITTKEGTAVSCHKKDGHGTLDMSNAYAQSCNAYFINLAHMTGEDMITETARRMGVSESFTLDGVFLCTSDVPDSSESPSTLSGYLANTAIGQGRILMSVPAACRMFACAVTGYDVPLHILYGIYDGNSFIRRYNGKNAKTRVLSHKTCVKLKEMMCLCTSEGLGREAASPDGLACGKTATAQSGSCSDGKEILNCWFCGVYPSDNPEYAVSVLFCDTKNGNKAKITFREICEYLKRR